MFWGYENKHILSPRIQITPSQQRQHDELKSKLTLMSSVIEKNIYIVAMEHENLALTYPPKLYQHRKKKIILHAILSYADCIRFTALLIYFEVD